MPNLRVYLFDKLFFKITRLVNFEKNGDFFLVKSSDRSGRSHLCLSLADDIFIGKSSKVNESHCSIDFDASTLKFKCPVMLDNNK